MRDLGEGRRLRVEILRWGGWHVALSIVVLCDDYGVGVRSIVA